MISAPPPTPGGLADIPHRAKRKRIDELFSWSAAGFLLGLITFIFGLYTSLHTKQPAIELDIEAETDVVDLHSPLQDLAIYFKGEDIRAQNLNLRILSIRVSNKGDLDLLQGQYDQADPWGFILTPGRIVDVRVTASNSKYLQTHLNPRAVGADRIVFDKCIFEKQKWLALDVLVVHNKSVTPALNPFGKIAGAETIPVLKPYLTRDHETLWAKVTTGTFVVHIIRFVFYLVLAIAVIVSVAVIWLALSLSIERIKMTRRRAKVARLSPPEEGERAQWDILVDVYVSYGIAALKKLRRDLRHPEVLEGAVESLRAAIAERDSLGEFHISEVQARIRYRQIFSASIEKLVEARLVTLTPDGKTILIDPAISHLLDELPDLLEPS